MKLLTVNGWPAGGATRQRLIEGLLIDFRRLRFARLS